MALVAIIARAVSLKNLRKGSKNNNQTESYQLRCISEENTEKSSEHQSKRNALSNIEQELRSGGNRLSIQSDNSSFMSIKNHKRSEPTKLNGLACHLIIKQILHKVNELENSLYEDQQEEFKLRMTLERQTERIHELRFSLNREKKRNQRLVQLIRTTDTLSHTDDEIEDSNASHHNWQLTLDSISPLLMQQRYDEMSTSYKQTRRQLAKKNRLLTLAQCEKEQLQAKYDDLFDEYHNEQKRFEDVCGKFLTLQFKKKQEILYLGEALSYASDCIISAQNIIGKYQRIDENYDKEFHQNLQYFIQALTQFSCIHQSTSDN